MLLCDKTNVPVLPPLLYNDARAANAVAEIAAHAPPAHIVASATSSLAKLRYLLQHSESKHARYFSDQASWLAAMLTGKPGISDYHNALKLGYDVEALVWPTWMASLHVAPCLPQVVPPGTRLGKLAPEVAAKLGIPLGCIVRAGTTDSIAAFIASGAHAPGTAVTSLGSTLVLKLLSTTRVEDSRYGIYSHRFGSLWLAGGASNSGGAVLRQFFNDDALAQLSQRIRPEIASRLNYYPLPGVGERFPVHDPELAPQLSPRPNDDVAFLHGLLQGIARIEQQGYAKFAELGATPPLQVTTAGGGSRNPQWQSIRERQLGIPVSIAANTEAAYGSAILAKGLDFT